MAQNFAVGDLVCKINGHCNSALKGLVYTVGRRTDGVLGIGADPNDMCACQGDWELVTSKKSEKTNMNLKDKFALAFKKEPEKSLYQGRSNELG